MAENKHVVVLVCLQDTNYNAELLELALHSLRRCAQYEGDIVVFTDFARELKGEKALRLNRVQITDYPSDDPRNFRIFMDKYHDFRPYKKIIYMDFDILVMKNINKAFNFIKDDSVYFTYAPVFPWENEAFMAGAYLNQYKHSAIVKNSPTGICSGIFGLRSTVLGNLLSQWRTVLQRTATNNDQHALNELLVKEMLRARAFPSEWVSYPVQVRSQSDDKRRFLKKRDFIFHHFNPTDNRTKYQMMSAQMLAQGVILPKS